MADKLQIRKGGKLIDTKWVFDKEKREGEYQEVDVTDQAIRYLFEPCSLAEDVTLKDIFLLLNSELELFNVVIGNWCKEIVTEGLTGPAKPYDLSIYDPEQIEYLKLYYAPEYDVEDKGDVLYGFHRPQFGGEGIVLQADYDYHKQGERIPWGISFTPSNELINIPVKLHNKFTIYEGIMKWDKSKGAATRALADFDNPTYTLGGILEGIIWELSFHGGPESRNEKSQELKDIVAKIKTENKDEN